MSGPSWLIDSKRIATKIKNASTAVDPRRCKWISNPTKACPNCNHLIDNSDVVQEWPGLPKGVKFDPSDQELVSHLLAKVGTDDAKPHPFINEFIPTVEEEDGICYTHPQKLPGVKQDGSVIHFFHRTFKAYNIGTRKRRKINTDDLGDVRWHKTGKTKPVIVDGKQLGCKKIMVLYMSKIKGGKPAKTNWVMHQYHLGTGEDEKDGEYVVSKIFYQKQTKTGDKNGPDPSPEIETAVAEFDPAPAMQSVSSEQDADKQDHVNMHEQTSIQEPTHAATKSVSPEQDADKHDHVAMPEQTSILPRTHNAGDELHMHLEGKKHDEQAGNPTEDTKWWEGESQYLLDSQQLAEQMAICEEFLHSQSSCAGEEAKKTAPSLADYARMGSEVLKRDLEECQNLDAVGPNIEHDTQDLRLSQLEFGSQDSFLAWSGSKVAED